MAWLEGTFLESRRFYAPTASGLIAELWVSDRTGTWTWMTTTAAGFSCILHHGTDAEAMDLLGILH